jgi:5-(aminomethyl)-3-furanmethanol phosphate kinase
MARLRTSVAKIGGSLLTAPNLAQRLRTWLEAETAAQPGTHFVLLVGGGRLVDMVREIDARVPLGDEAAHQIAIALMDVSSQIVASMLPELSCTADFDELLQRIETPGITLFQPARFMVEVEPHHAGLRLPASWMVTSDSIAARLAIMLGAKELVLAKSSPPPGDASPVAISLWAESGYVDAYLPRLSAEIPAVRAVVP